MSVLRLDGPVSSGAGSLRPGNLSVTVDSEILKKCKDARIANLPWFCDFSCRSARAGDRGAGQAARYRALPSAQAKPGAAQSAGLQPAAVHVPLAVPVLLQFGSWGKRVAGGHAARGAEGEALRHCLHKQALPTIPAAAFFSIGLDSYGAWGKRVRYSRFAQATAAGWRGHALPPTIAGREMFSLRSEAHSAAGGGARTYLQSDRQAASPRR
jgi:hypothetical protein